MWNATCIAFIYKISHFSWRRGLICHHIPQLKGIGRKSPYVVKRVPVSHVKLKSTQTNIIEPRLEHEVWLTPIQVHVSSLEGFLFFSPPSIIPYFLTVLLLFQHAEVACSRHMQIQTPSIFGHASSRALWKSMSVCRLVYHFGLNWNISTTFWWIEMEFCTDIYFLLRMNCNHFGDPLTVPL